MHGGAECLHCTVCNGPRGSWLSRLSESNQPNQIRDVICIFNSVGKDGPGTLAPSIIASHGHPLRQASKSVSRWLLLSGVLLTVSVVEVQGLSTVLLPVASHGGVTGRDVGLVPQPEDLGCEPASTSLHATQSTVNCEMRA